MQQHMSTQDSKFEDFYSYVKKSLLSLRTDMNTNHVVILVKINHLISAQEEDSGHYERFYREMCDFLDSQFRNEGQGWHMRERLIPRRCGRI